ncbi:hypothetical protein Q4S30_07080 [Morganella morganii]
MDVNDDDYGFSMLAQNESTLDIVIDRFFNWSARLPIDAAMFSLINNMPLLIIINSLLLICIFTSFYIINKSIFRIEHGIKIFTMLVISITLIPVYIANDSILWVTGSFNYLWPAAFFLIGMVRFFIKKRSYLISIVCIASSCFSVYSEQIIVISIFIFPLLFIYKNKTSSICSTDIIQVLLMISNIAIQVLSPANEIRFNAEVLRGFNDFFDKSIFEKISIGVIMSIDYIFNKYNTLYITLAIIISHLLFINKTNYHKTLSLLISLPPILSFLFKMSPDFISPTNVLSIKNNALILIGLFSISLVSYSLFIISIKHKLLLPFLFMLSILIIIAIGFAPTTYVERPRVYFFTCIIILYIIYTLFLITKKLATSNTFYFLSCICLSLGVAQYVVYQIINIV